MQLVAQRVLLGVSGGIAAYKSADLVRRLRRKIENDASHPVFLRTVWGKGYMFTPKGDQNSG